MNTSTIAEYLQISPSLSPRARLGRYAIALSLTAIPLFGGAPTREAFLTSLSSAYISVTVFVALTLLIFYSLEHFLKVDTGALLQKYRRFQIPIAAVLGALPGCGGAIMVMTQFSIGRAGFGAVVAVLTSTMGDAAFLLIAKEPLTGLGIMALSMVVGTVSGYIVERIHGYDFLRVADSAKSATPLSYRFGKLNWPWLAMLVPGITFGLMAAFQMDIDAFFGVPGLELGVGVTGALLSLFLWFINPASIASYVNRTDTESLDYIWDKTTIDTCFVTVWVIVAFLMFELTIVWAGWDLKAAFATVGVFVPLMGILIGLLPGCGPQVLTTTLYLQGVIPLSAQIGNALSNDGDALFPAMAVAPRASIIATLYTAVPALIVAYSFYFLFER
ncbi:MAG: putative manganese transporter [Pseudomonadota bacterium]